MIFFIHSAWLCIINGMSKMTLPMCFNFSHLFLTVQVVCRELFNSSFIYSSKEPIYLVFQVFQVCQLTLDNDIHFFPFSFQSSTRKSLFYSILIAHCNLKKKIFKVSNHHAINPLCEPIYLVPSILLTYSPVSIKNTVLRSNWQYNASTAEMA